jgi:hypothetical protein
MRYFINTISRAHVQKGIEGGFTQADHGDDKRLKRIAKGDAIVFYSPRTDFPDGEKLQLFTAIGDVLDEAPYEVEMAPDFKPWRRKLAFRECKEAPVQPLIEHLSFIPDKKRWGFPFRRGLFEINQSDFETIARAMQSRGA